MRRAARVRRGQQAVRPLCCPLAVRCGLPWAGDGSNSRRRSLVPSPFLRFGCRPDRKAVRDRGRVSPVEPNERNECTVTETVTETHWRSAQSTCTCGHMLLHPPSSPVSRSIDLAGRCCTLLAPPFGRPPPAAPSCPAPPAGMLAISRNLYRDNLHSVWLDPSNGNWTGHGRDRW
jgi:hypothetical protein